MRITDAFRLAADVRFLPGSILTPADRELLNCSEEEVVISRPASRANSKVVSGDVAHLLRLFASPRTIVSTALELCEADGADPRATLREVFDTIAPFISLGWVYTGAERQSTADEFTYSPGTSVGGFLIVEPVLAMEDSEVYKARTEDGTDVALKLARLPTPPDVQAQFSTEARALQRAAGAPAAQLVDSGHIDGRASCATRWVDAVPVTTRGRDLRHQRDRAGLLRLFVEVVGAYATLHSRGVIHGDAYPRNLLIDDAGKVHVIDFGMAHISGQIPDPALRRMASPEFYDPQLAAAILGGTDLPPPDAASDQYALAAILFLTATGRTYLDFSTQRQPMLTSIVFDPPLTFASSGVSAWPELESVLRRALSKDPASRFPDVGQFHDALRAIPQPRREEHGAARESRERRAWALDLLHGLDAPEAWEGSLLTGDPVASVTHGAAGVAAGLLEAAVLTEDPRDLQRADLWITRAELHRDRRNAFTSSRLELTQERIGPRSVFYGEPGIDVVCARVAAAMGDTARFSGSIARLAPVADASGGDDLTLGRAGLLLTAALLMDDLDLEAAVGSPDPQIAIEAMATATGRQVSPAIEGWTHLGMAHGVAGFLHAALLWAQQRQVPPPPEVVDAVRELAARARPAGRGLRWPMRSGPEESEFFESLCHGTPGHVLLFSTAARVISDEFTDTTIRAAWTVTDTEAANASLCCGDAGRAYALLAAYRVTGDPAWLHRARAAGALAYEHAGSLPTQTALFQGAVGPAVLQLALDDPDRGSFPMLERWIV